VGASRWPIETEFETQKINVGLDVYETRTWAGWHTHLPVPVGWGVPVKPSTGLGKNMPQITRPQVYRVVREMLPRERFWPTELLRWLEDIQQRNERAERSHEKRRTALCWAASWSSDR
jgi:hypothetical protein